MKAFMKKEWMEMTRTGRLWILLFIFVLFGIMNPAVAKMTPWLMKMMSDSFADAGIVIKEVPVSAMDSWTQFFKNMPMGLIAFVLIWSASFTTEYQRGTLIQIVAKGMSRSKILAAKAGMMFGMWTVLYLICFGITYGYNAYFWDNGVASNLVFGVFCYWLFGIWVIAFLVLFSTLAQSNTQVLVGTGVVVFGVYLLGMLKIIGKFLPVKLMDGITILKGMTVQKDYIGSICMTTGMIIISLMMAVIFFQKKRL